MLFSSNDGIGLLNLGDADIDSSHWFGQYFKPILPNGTTSWRVTRLKILARNHGPPKGTARIQIRSTGSSTMTPRVVLDEATMQEAALTSTYSWQEFSFSNANGIDPGAGACIVVQWGSDADACDVQYQALLGLVPNANLITTINGGSSWSAPLAQDLVYYVYGTYSNPNPVVYDYYVTDVRCSLRTGPDPQRRLYATARVLNEPQVTGP
jgi:hypothetical protein